MKYDEVMAIHNLSQKNIGDIIEDSDIKDIEILVELCNRQANEIIDLYNELKKE